MNNVGSFLNQFKVYDVGLTKIRLGSQNDGGYIVLKEICEKTPMVYGFGIGDDVGFETDFAKMYPQANFKLFDPTIEKLPLGHPRFEFHKEGVIWDKWIEPIIEKNSLLKMDIEGNEWDSLSILDWSVLEQWSQILIEFHIIYAEPREGLTPYFRKFYQENFKRINDELFAKYYEVIKKLNEQFYIFHIHANNSLPKIEVGGYSFPPLIELSFVRKDLVKNVTKTTTIFPVEDLDFPNKIDRPDILNWWPMC